MSGKVELNSSNATAVVYCPIADAPAELLANIFSRLPNWDLAACALVCHRWEEQLDVTEGVKQLFLRKFPSVSLEGIADADLKKEYIRKNRLDWNYRLGIYCSSVLGRHSVTGLLFAGCELFSMSICSLTEVVKIWDVEERECKSRISPLRVHGACIAVAGDRIFLDAAVKGKILVWDRSLYAWGRTLDGHSGEVTVLATAEIFSDSGEKKKMLISGADDMKIMIWDIDDAKCIKTLEGHNAKITALAVANDRFFSGSEDGTIMAWDLNSFECKGSIQGHQEKISSFSIDENRLFSASADKLIVAWDVNTLKKIATLEGHKGGVVCMVVADHFLISSGLHELKIWELDNFICTATLKVVGDYHMALAAKNGKLFSDAPAPNLDKLVVKDFCLGLGSVLKGIAKEFRGSNLKNEETRARFDRLPEYVKKEILGDNTTGLSDSKMAQAIEDYVEKRYGQTTI